MKFSLILCTINRTKELKELLLSLSIQTYKKFEIIIVDQNNNDLIKAILQEFKFLDINYIKSEPGLSKSRNIGLQYVTGNIICFPDDDCIYPPILLENIYNYFKKNNNDILMGKTIDKKTNKIVAGKNILKKQVLKKSKILGSSTTLFLRITPSEIYFDERFGLGAKFNSEEENDLLFRLLSKGYKGFYNPEINYVFHPPSDLNYTDYNRAKSRAIGLGAFIAKHIKTIDGIRYFVNYNILRPLIASFIYLLQFDVIKSKFYLYRFIGIWSGFYMYFEKNKCT